MIWLKRKEKCNFVALKFLFSNYKMTPLNFLATKATQYTSSSAHNSPLKHSSTTIRLSGDTENQSRPLVTTCFPSSIQNKQKLLSLSKSLKKGERIQNDLNFLIWLMQAKQNQMASLHILKSALSPFSISQSSFPGKSDSRKRILKLKTFGGSSTTYFERKTFRVFCSVQEGDNQSNGKFGWIYSISLPCFM